MARAKSNETETEKPKGLSESEPLTNIVGDYPERSYADAVTDEQRKALEVDGYEIGKKTVVDPTSAPDA